jgi:hypothetical protein
MSDKKPPAPSPALPLITANDLTQTVARFFDRVLKEGVEVSDGQGGTVKVTAGAKYAEAAMKFAALHGGVMRDANDSVDEKVRAQLRQKRQVALPPAPDTAEIEELMGDFQQGVTHTTDAED